MSYEWSDSESLSEADDVDAGLSVVFGDGARLTSAGALDHWIVDRLSRLTPQEEESVLGALGDVGRWAKSSQVRQFAGTALPTVGTLVGTAYGGPAGAAIGGGLGGAAGKAVSGGGRSAQPRVQSARPTAALAVTPPTQAPAPTGAEPLGEPIAHAASDPAAAGSQAAAQLLSLVQNPALLSSLLALVMGAHGRPSVPVGEKGTEVPVGAMMNLVGTLANRAAEDAEELLSSRRDATPAYLLDDEGCVLCDPAVPSQRADALLRVLAQAEEPDWGDDDLNDPQDAWWGGDATEDQGWW
ncbi:MAG: hypothetical protein ABR543_03705 [Gemmatimonadaceae bacterium]